MLDSQGFVSETNATNLFMIKKGVLSTPHADSCLPGITRSKVMSIAKEMTFSAVERNISISEFYSADEVFTTGTMGELAEVVEIDGRTIENHSNLSLLSALREEFNLTMIFISHDLKVIEHFCDRVLVMYLGNIVEELPCDDLHEQALHPYTKALLGSNPIDDPDDKRPLTVLKGDVPSPLNPPAGCPFVARCPVAEERCKTEMPDLVNKDEAHRVACWAV